MRVVLINNDFRVYWKSRLLYLHKFLTNKNIELYAVELFGKGSPYTFDSHNDENDWWNCLFPHKSAEDLSAKEIETLIFAALDKIDADVVIAPSIVFYAGALGLRWAKHNKKKFIMFDDAKPTQVKRNFLVQWIKDTITAQADGFWLPAKEYEKYYRHFSNKKVHLFYGYSCVDNDHFKPDKQKKFDHYSILCVARLVPVKNIDNLLRAWQLVEQKHSGYKLKIVGTGPDQDKLKGLSANLNLKNIEFLGAIANHDIPYYFNRSDAFILPSLSEAWGLAVNEATAAGLPVLLSKQTNAANTLLADGKNGFSFDAYQVTDIAGAIIKFIDLSEQEKQQMSVLSLKLINKMSYENMSTKLLAALTKISASPSKKTTPLASLLIKKWSGRYDTTAWDSLPTQKSV